MKLRGTTKARVCRENWKALLIDAAIAVSVLGFVTGCASPPASNGSVFKANEVDVGVSSSVIER